MEKKLSPLFTTDTLSITLNPSDRLQFRGKPDKFKSLMKTIERHATEWFTGIEYLKLWPDLSFPSELNKKHYPRIHYHGIVKFYDPVKFLLDSNIHEYFSVNIDTIDDMAVWRKYCTKFIKKYNLFSVYHIYYSNTGDETITIKDFIDIDRIADLEDSDPETSSEEDDNIITAE